MTGGESLVIPGRLHLMSPSLPHWVAFWAVGEPNTSLHLTLYSMFAGFKWSLIDYAKKIEDLFAKMKGMRSVVYAPNREAVDGYFAYVWGPIHALTAAVLSQSSESGDLKKFKSYLDAEEHRLRKNLQAINYIIDGVDIIPLIAGKGRIEKVRI